MQQQRRGGNMMQGGAYGNANYGMQQRGPYIPQGQPMNMGMMPMGGQGAGRRRGGIQQKLRNTQNAVMAANMNDQGLSKNQRRRLNLQMRLQQEMMQMQRPLPQQQRVMTPQGMNRQRGGMMMPMGNGQQPINNNMMMGTGTAARRLARQNNAYRLGGATNVNRLRRAQQVGARVQQQQQQNRNNQQVVGVNQRSKQIRKPLQGGGVPQNNQRQGNGSQIQRNNQNNQGRQQQQNNQGNNRNNRQGGNQGMQQANGLARRGRTLGRRSGTGNMAQNNRRQQPNANNRNNNQNQNNSQNNNNNRNQQNNQNKQNDQGRAKSVGRQQNQNQNQQPKQPKPQADPNVPRSTPTGVPNLSSLELPPETQLKQLQVKAELAKLGEAPRAYFEKIKASSDELMQEDATAALSLMAIGSGAQSHRLSLTERFEKIQGARPGLPPSTEGAGGKTLRIVPKPKQNAQSRRYNR